jgi:hypothetical protein
LEFGHGLQQDRQLGAIGNHEADLTARGSSSRRSRRSAPKAANSSLLVAELGCTSGLSMGHMHQHGILSHKRVDAVTLCHVKSNVLGDSNRASLTLTHG